MLLHPVRFIEAGKTRYSVALLDMDIAVEAVQGGEDECVFIVEHEAMYSAGRNFAESDFLERRVDIPVYYPGRGGRITVHSPGQIVLYPIINLRQRSIGVEQYVELLECWIVRTLSTFGIEASGSADGRGVWTAFGKIGFIGIRISKGVSYHGLCLNVSNDLGLFDAIIPCGLQNAKITSVELVLQRHIDMQTVTQAFIETSPF